MKHLTLAQRYIISVMKKQNYSQKEIAKAGKFYFDVLREIQVCSMEEKTFPLLFSKTIVKIITN